MFSPQRRGSPAISVYECARGGLRAAQTLFIPQGENVELWDLVLENPSGAPLYVFPAAAGFSCYGYAL